MKATIESKKEFDVLGKLFIGERGNMKIFAVEWHGMEAFFHFIQGSEGIVLHVRRPCRC